MQSLTKEFIDKLTNIPETIPLFDYPCLHSYDILSNWIDHVNSIGGKSSDVLNCIRGGLFRQTPIEMENADPVPGSRVSIQDLPSATYSTASCCGTTVSTYGDGIRYIVIPRTIVSITLYMGSDGSGGTYQIEWDTTDIQNSYSDYTPDNHYIYLSLLKPFIPYFPFSEFRLKFVGPGCDDVRYEVLQIPGYRQFGDCYGIEFMAKGGIIGTHILAGIHRNLSVTDKPCQDCDDRGLYATSKK